jgi:hypothetical protein
MAEGETLIAERRAEAFALFPGKKSKGDPLIHHGQGEVVFHMTDRRALVLVDPSLGQARRVLHLPGAESWTKGMELFKVIQGHGRYYLELPWSEVPTVKMPSQRKETASIRIVPAGGEIHTLLVDRETAGWIERVLTDVESSH